MVILASEYDIWKELIGMKEEFLQFLSDNENEFVNSFLQGYSEYISERIEKENEMLVSNGYAWTKANHIENAVGKYIQDHLNDTMKVHKAKAGYSWIYLQFSDDVTNSLMIIREVETVKEGANPKEYLKKLVEINESISCEKVGEPIQLDLFGNEQDIVSNAEATNFDHFYILTYMIDENTKDIKQLKVEKPVFDQLNRIYFDKDSSLTLHINSDNPYLLSESQKNSILNMDDIIGGTNVEGIVLSGEEYGGMVAKDKRKKQNE